jgi:hypothetical protein
LHQTYVNFTCLNWCPYFLILKVGNYECISDVVVFAFDVPDISAISLLKVPYRR